MATKTKKAPAKRQRTQKAPAKKATKAQPKKATKQDPVDAFKARYPHVVEVTELSSKGTPARVVIRCTADGCDETRGIASQDAFQVKRCVGCQREYQKARRRKSA